MEATDTVLPTRTPARVLGCGAFLKNRAVRLDGAQARWSPVHGDLGTVEACAAMQRSIESLLAGDAPPQALAHDLHPDFESTRVAIAQAGRLGVPAIAVQHHHAHIAAVIAEHGLARPVVGLALDGVGLGTDGAAWGGELLWVDGGLHAHRWARVAHLHPLALPGGDVAAREPWRMAAAVLHALGRGEHIESRFGPVVGTATAKGLRTMLDRRLHCPTTTSAGRWFDAAAGALGLSVRQTEEAEAAIALERAAAHWLGDDPGFDLPWTSLDLRQVVGALFDVDPANFAQIARGAASFHLALANGLAHAAIEAARERGCRDVALGGGCFFNRILRERVTATLKEAGLAVHAPGAIGCGDAALALGQAWVAACTLADPSKTP